MLLFKKITAIILSIALGLIFIYSAWAKLLPIIETFEMSFVETGVAGWYTAPIMARMMVGLEFYLGLLFLMNYNLKGFTLKVAVSLLVFFTIYLLLEIIYEGNEGNCGCFGEHFYMTPLQAIIKNLLMILACVVIYFLPAGWRVNKNNLLLSLLAIAPFALPFILNPVDYSYTSNNLEEKVNYPLELELLYGHEDTSTVQVPSVELRKGKHVLALLSLTCRHCRIAAKKFKLIKEANPEIPIYFLLNGERRDYADFIAETGASNIPSSYCLGKTFVQLATTELPRIYYLDDGMVVKKVNYFELNQYDIEKWLENEVP